MLGFRTVPKLRHLRFLSGIFLFVNIIDRYFVAWTKDEKMREAMSGKKLLSCVYHGKFRIIEVHVYGRKNDKNGILAYQVGGESSQNALGWRRMHLNEISDLRVLDRTFDGKREVTGKHSDWDFTYFIVD